MEIKFWGTRGSIPTPAQNCMKYGGNTSCLSVNFKDGNLLILDAGTGIRKLGIELLKKNKKIKAHILISHPHWDHIQGIPFFNPLYMEEHEFTILGCAAANKYIKRSLNNLMNQPYFPVGFETLKAKMNFVNKCNGVLAIGKAKVEMTRVNHPGRSLAFKISEGKKSFVYMTDNELNSNVLNKVPHSNLVDFCRGVDFLVHDAQYTPEEYKLKEGWGHSSYVQALQFAHESKVAQLALFHHEPAYTDKRLDSILADSRARLRSMGSKVHCLTAREGLKVTI